MAERRPLTASERKHRARIYNEGLRLVATLYNSLSMVTFGTAFVAPIAQGNLAIPGSGGWLLLLAALSLHAVAHVAIRQLRPED